MKTAEEWFKTLPEPYQTQAIENTNEERRVIKYNSLGHAITLSFNFRTSNEGIEYWKKMYNLLS